MITLQAQLLLASLLKVLFPVVATYIFTQEILGEFYILLNCDLLTPIYSHTALLENLSPTTKRYITPLNQKLRKTSLAFLSSIIALCAFRLTTSNQFSINSLSTLCIFMLYSLLMREVALLKATLAVFHNKFIGLFELALAGLKYISLFIAWEVSKFSIFTSQSQTAVILFVSAAIVTLPLVLLFTSHLNLNGLTSKSQSKYHDEPPASTSIYNAIAIVDAGSYRLLRLSMNILLTPRLIFLFTLAEQVAMNLKNVLSVRFPSYYIPCENNRTKAQAARDHTFKSLLRYIYASLFITLLALIASWQKNLIYDASSIISKPFIIALVYSFLSLLPNIPASALYYESIALMKPKIALNAALLSLLVASACATVPLVLGEISRDVVLRTSFYCILGVLYYLLPFLQLRVSISQSIESDS